ncbi:MAG: hypothetical protein QOF81_125, partial [Acidimicrobiaceae bacterium]|nr:hypothetical protein [Acidimicrobiaceae bacterium]
ARWALPLVLMLCLSACQATVRVGVDVKQNGGGSVTVTAHLDRDAASFAPSVRTSDLVKSGWKVVGPTSVANGGVDFTATKSFASPAQAKTIVAELSGPTGPFRDLSIARHQSFFRTATTFQGNIDLTCGLDCFSDPQLKQALGGAPDLGIDPSKLQADAGIIVDRLFQFEVAARLPGTLKSSNAPTQAGNGALWKARLGQRAVLTAGAQAWNVGHILLVVAVGILLLAGVVLAALTLRPGRHRPAHKAS